MVPPGRSNLAGISWPSGRSSWRYCSCGVDAARIDETANAQASARCSGVCSIPTRAATSPEAKMTSSAGVNVTLERPKQAQTSALLGTWTSPDQAGREHRMPTIPCGRFSLASSHAAGASCRRFKAEQSGSSLTRCSTQPIVGGYCWSRARSSSVSCFAGTGQHCRPEVGGWRCIPESSRNLMY